MLRSASESSRRPWHVLAMSVWLISLPADPLAKRIPSHWLDITSNDMSATTEPVRSPRMVTGASAVPELRKMPCTTIAALS